MNATGNPLRDKILEKLAGSSSQNPVDLGVLRKLDKYPVAIDTMLVDLCNEGLITVVRGYRNSAPYSSYWLTGMTKSSTQFNKSALPQRPARVGSIQRATATCIGCGCDDDHACEDGCYWLRVDRKLGKGVCSQCPEFVKEWDADRSKPPAKHKLSKQEATMAKQDAARGMGKTIVNFVNNNPGTTLENLRAEINKFIPDIAMKQVASMVYYLAKQGSIEKRGRGETLTLHPCGKVPAAKAKPSAQPKQRQPNKQPATQSAAINGSELRCAFNMDGTVAIGKADSVIQLDRLEAERVWQFFGQCLNLDAAAS